MENADVVVDSDVGNPEIDGGKDGPGALFTVLLTSRTSECKTLDDCKFVIPECLLSTLTFDMAEEASIRLGFASDESAMDIEAFMMILLNRCQ
jgi:hypothetical protein